MSELISGEEAMVASYRGEAVQYQADKEVWLDIKNSPDWSIRDFQSKIFKFRKKPKTKTVTLELPETFQPKVGEKYWAITVGESCGYDFFEWDGYPSDERITQFGAYRTEADVIKVRDAFRQLKAK